MKFQFSIISRVAKDGEKPLILGVLDLPKQKEVTFEVLAKTVANAISVSIDQNRNVTGIAPKVVLVQALEAEPKTED